MREDDSDGSITITDPKTKKTYVLHSKTKEYSERPKNTGVDKMKVTTSAHVKATSQKKVIAGKASNLYLIDMIIDMQMPGMTETGPSMGTVHVAIKMNQWMTTATKDKLKASDTMDAMGEMISGLGSMGADENALRKEFSKLRGLPLDMDVTIKGDMKWSKDAPQGMTAQLPKGFNMKVVSTVQSISEAPLSMDLFKIPAGYKKTNVVRPGRGMGGK
jgi:hypothetical protein